MPVRNKLKIAFLDRDGVINQFPGNGTYCMRVKDFNFIPGSREAIKNLTDAGYTLFVVSNQAGVGKGWFTQRKLDQINNHMMRGVKKAGGKIKHAFYATAKSTDGCPNRKPGIGHIKKAFDILKQPMSRYIKDSFFVGDTVGDIQCGINAGCKTIFVLSGRENRRHIKKWDVRPDYIAKDLLEASNIIQDENSDYSRLRRCRA